MALDYSTLVFGPLHTVFGVTASLDVPGNTASPFSISAIDKTKGVEVENAGNVGMFTVRPAVYLRAVDLADINLDPEDLTGAGLTLNSRSWTVKAVQVRPTPGGESDGQVVLYLGED